MDRFEEGQMPADLPALDFLGRMPVPLRRPFKAQLDGWIAGQRETSGERLASCFLKGSEYYRPFDALSRIRSADELPALIVSPASLDLLGGSAFDLCAQDQPPELPPLASACIEAGLVDPRQRFFTFALIPFVFLVDRDKLGRRAMPRRWSDLFAPALRDEIVIGGWRPGERGPWRDFNAFLLACLHGEFGASRLERFAINVRRLQHNVVTARLMGSDSEHCGAIAILPWLQASMCPQRERCQIVWPEDGALVMPIGMLFGARARSRVQALVAGLAGDELAATLDANAYPCAWAGRTALPTGARLKWPGWSRMRALARSRARDETARIFFDAWWSKQGDRRCA